MPEEQTREYGEKSQFALTRELELLISGALVFALLGLPDLIDLRWERLHAHLGGASFGVGFSVYYVAKLASYALITTILLHFLLRGFWVALLGLRDAFPGEIDRSQLPQGSVFKEFYATRLTSIEVLEDRVDRVAASIFAFIFLFFFLLMVSVLWAGTGGLLAIAVARLTRRPDLLTIVFWSFFALLPMQQLVLAGLDKYSKTRELSPGAQRIAKRILRFTHFSTLAFISAPIFFTFTTRISKKLLSLIQVGFAYGMIAIFMVSIFFSSGFLGFDSYVYFPPRAESEQLRTSNYESLKTDRTAITPTIQSDMITDPYIRLFIPYNARRDNDRIRRLCGDVQPFRSDGLHVRPRTKSDRAKTAGVLTCFSKLASVELDGRPLQLDWSLYIHPISYQHGRIAMIPTAPLTAGKHMIIVRRTPVAGLDRPTALMEHYIPFWK